MLPRWTLRTLALAFGLFTVGIVVDEVTAPWLPAGMAVGEAHARVGRPATPGSDS